jgi:hypothetical protein
MKNVLRLNAYEMPKEYGIRVLTKGSKHTQSLNHKHYFTLVLNVFFPQNIFFIQMNFFATYYKND